MWSLIIMTRDKFKKNKKDVRGRKVRTALVFIGSESRYDPLVLSMNGINSYQVCLLSGLSSCGQYFGMTETSTVKSYVKTIHNKNSVIVSLDTFKFHFIYKVSFTVNQIWQ